MNKRPNTERTFQIEQENQDLKDRIKRSKPILSTIYDKIKRKQKFLHNKIDHDRRVITQYKGVAKDFKQLYQESLQIMYRAKLFDKFDETNTNFIRKKPQKDGLQKYKSKSVYQQYRQRIEKYTNKNKQQRNPQIDILKKQNQLLKNQMIQGINKLRIARQKSQKNLKRTKSSNIIKGNLLHKHPIDQNQFKRKLIQRNKERLSRIS